MRLKAKIKQSLKPETDLSGIPYSHQHRAVIGALDVVLDVFNNFGSRRVAIGGTLVLNS
jgi:hypothetical protein